MLGDVGQSHHAVVVRNQDDVDSRQVEQLSLEKKEKKTQSDLKMSHKPYTVFSKHGTIMVYE